MTPERYRQIGKIFEDALKLNPSQRAVFLQESSLGDPTLRKEVEALLAAHNRAGDFIEAPAMEAAARTLANKANRPRLSKGSILGQYEVLSLLGSGGMGQVYAAQCAQLNRRVALKVLRDDLMAEPERVRRFQQEARAVSSLNHPNIVTIHEISRSGDVHFIAYEFVEGETLRQRIERGLKLGETLDIAIQVGNALVAAHDAGVIHRDLKPENIMVRPDGYVKVLDFGLAKLVGATADSNSSAPTVNEQTETGAIMGTFRYMSPEQARGTTIDPRTDIFSFGVILYEMVAGRRPFEGQTSSDVIAAVLTEEPQPLTRYAPDCSAELQRIIAKALAKNPDERYQTARDFWLDLKSLKQELDTATRPRSGGRLASSRSRLKTVLLAATSVLAISTMAVMYFNRRPVLAERETVLLADFVNTTGDTAFDGALKQALAVQLQQTPFLSLFHDDGIRATLATMVRPPDEPITREVGLEIARRRGLKAIIVGTIASLGKNYVITLVALDARSGADLGSHQVEVDAKERVISGLGDAAKQLRRKLGESLSTLEKYDAPIELATTSSLEALKTESAALRLFLAGNIRESRPLFERAVEQDPNFADAYQWLAWNHVNLGDYGKGATAAEKAFSLRERLTDWEKYYVDTTYYHWATGDWEKQMEIATPFTLLYPNDFNGPQDLLVNNLGLGRFETAINHGRKSMKLNPDQPWVYRFIATAFVGLNRFAEAREIMRMAQEKNFNDHPLLFRIAFLEGDEESMQQELNIIAKGSEGNALQWQARRSAYFGRWKEAIRFQRRSELSPGNAVTGGRLRLVIDALSSKSLFGLCAPKDREFIEASAESRLLSPAVPVDVPFQTDGSLCGTVEQAEKLSTEIETRYPKSTIHRAFSLPLIRAAIHLRLNQPERALEALRPALEYEGGSGTPGGNGMPYYLVYLRGQAYLRLGRHAEAAAEFQKILDHSGWNGNLSPIYPLTYLALARTHQTGSNDDASRKAYQNFIAIWKDADSDLPVLVEAKKEFSRLN